ncbi:hypothetical protein D0T87_15880 [Bacteroides sp. 51]|nr:hypothetical protein [Bacteroides sp. 51]
MKKVDHSFQKGERRQKKRVFLSRRVSVKLKPTLFVIKFTKFSFQKGERKQKWSFFLSRRVSVPFQKGERSFQKGERTFPEG